MVIWLYNLQPSYFVDFSFHILKRKNLILFSCFPVFIFFYFWSRYHLEHYWPSLHYWGLFCKFILLNLGHHLEVCFFSSHKLAIAENSVTPIINYKLYYLPLCFWKHINFVFLVISLQENRLRFSQLLKWFYRLKFSSKIFVIKYYRGVILLFIIYRSERQQG